MTAALDWIAAAIRARRVGSPSLAPGRCGAAPGVAGPGAVAALGQLAHEHVPLIGPRALAG